MKKRIFTYWVNPPEGLYPYIQLCLQTWFEHIPELELVVLDHENIKEWIDREDFDFNKFVLLPLPYQSDIASMAVLAKHGGIFMDADTIIFKDIFEEVEKINPEKFVAFGYPNTLNIHMAIMMCLNPGNVFMCEAAEIVIKRLNDITLEQIPSRYGDSSTGIIWSHFGNEVIHIAGSNEKARQCVEVLDRTKTGNILESRYLLDKKSTYEQYINFFFSTGTFSVNKAIKKVKFGVVSLHNSWTPAEYKSLSLEQVLASPTFLSELLRYSLSGFLT
jgi:mannosyltransferase OCH1-like enzyme